MSTNYNYFGNLVTNGLVLDLDAAKLASYPGTGTAWYDISGNNNNGTLTNGPTFSGIGKQASIVFDGVDDYVNLPTALPLNNVSQFSYSTFVKFNTSAGASGNTFFSYGVSSGFANDIMFAWDKASSNLFFQINNGSDGSGDYNYIPTNTWINISVVYNGSLATNSDKLKVFINGTSVILNYSYTVPSTTSTQVNPSCFIGRYTGYAPTWYFTGNMANTLLYNRALSADEITQNFNALRGRYGI